MALRATPWCQRCKRALAAIVDHRTPAGVAIAQAQASGKYGLDKWAGFFIRRNLQGLCYTCHSAKTDEDKGHVGEWSDVTTQMS